MFFKRGIHALEGRFHAFEKGVNIFEKEGGSHLFKYYFILLGGSRF